MQGEVCGPEKFIVSGDPRPNTAREASTFTDEKSAVEDVPPADLASMSMNAGQTDLGVCLESRFSRGKRFWHPEMTTKASYPIQSDTGLFGMRSRCEAPVHERAPGAWHLWRVRSLGRPRCRQLRYRPQILVKSIR